MILDVKNRQAIKGQVKFDLKIVRTVNGLALPLNCILNQGEWVGSCVYDDLCGYLKSILSLNEKNCPQNLIDNDIECTCPFNLPIRDLNINQSLDLPTNYVLFAGITSFPIPWISTGDFDVTIKLANETTNILCLNLKYSAKSV